ncbi:transcriptional regulator [Microbacterium testaceum]|uniref:transcriptional regulator n=1 Tax=Microbacterium testaceum TaxID=2033 RepID=UPI0022E425B5|nr:transcriptional regulator [Microbacterium testaceum]
MTQTNRTDRPVVLRPLPVASALWVVALAITLTIFVQVSEAARTAVASGVIPGSFIGLPLFEGFRNDGRIGVHPEWGLLVMLVVPAVLGILIALGVRATSMQK